MTYNRAWLRRVRGVRQSFPEIRKVIRAIPNVSDRHLVSQAFETAANDFENWLDKGYHTAEPESRIYQIAELARDLVKEGEQFTESLSRAAAS